jgi:hypothetical protein
MSYKSYLGQSNLPRGIRNNNAGNLIITGINWNGKIPVTQNTDGKFEQFIELRYGIRALMRDIYNDFTKGKKTVTSLINEFAPAFENNTSSYINSVIASTGGSNDIGELTQEKMIALCKAIVKVENGSNYQAYIKDKDYTDAIAILGITLKKKVVR